MFTCRVAGDDLVIDEKGDFIQSTKLDEFKSSKFSGSGSYRRDIKSATRIKKKFQLRLFLSNEDLRDFEKLLCGKVMKC